MMAEQSASSWGRSLVVVTGASRGFGAVLCEALVGRLGPGSLVIGLARDGHQLKELGLRLEQANSAVKFIALEADLSRPDDATLRGALERAVGAAEEDKTPWRSALLVHNAGSLGTLHYMSQLQDFEAISKYFDLNVSSIFPLNAILVDQAKALKQKDSDMKISVVNVSSLCAVCPMKSWSLYCTGKAARDMAFKVLAEEDSDLRVLNYAPGPLDTDMQKTAREETGDPALRASFADMHQKGTLLSAGQSVAKLLALLDRDTFKSGDHVDYYDDE